MQTKASTNSPISKDNLEKGFQLICTAKTMAEVYEENFKLVSKYVHATARGHEAIQAAAGMLLEEQDYLSAYYRDDCMLLSIGMQPYELMLQLLAKKDDPFSGGRSYYAHPSLNRPGMPKIPHQSSATGMQAIPATGVALGLKYKGLENLFENARDASGIVLCSLGDASITEGEVSEAFQMAALKQLPILYLIQDNEWDISANAAETRAQNAYEFIQGFHGIEAITMPGNDFSQAYQRMSEAVQYVRQERRPMLVHAEVPLLNHHTSGVRMEWYRDDLDDHKSRDPYPIARNQMLEAGYSEKEVSDMELEIRTKVEDDLKKAIDAPDPEPKDLYTHDFAPAAVTEETGTRRPEGAEDKVMVDCALLAVEELMRSHPECLLYGQDVGGRLGGVFREAATLAQKFGDNRVFNTPIQEAFIIGSTVGMSAVGLKPIVEVQFADYIWPGLNQLFTEVSRSCYLSEGKWPVSMILRVPIGAYGSGGPYHSSSVESVVTNIRGLKIAYPCNGADLNGLMKAAYDDPNPVVIFEHKGLYWSKIPGTHRAKSPLPSDDYRLPFGEGKSWVLAQEEQIKKGNTIGVISYGMGVHWATNAAERFPGRIEVFDLRTLHPLDEDGMFEVARRHGKVLVVTEEPVNNTFAQSLAARIQENCFESLDAPVRVVGSENMPAIPLNSVLEQTMIPNTDKVAEAIEALMDY